MNKRIAAWVAFAFALCLCSVTIAQQETKYKELPNLRQVNSSLYRGAQPKKGGLQLLKQLGIKTIISLRDDDEQSKAEEAEAKTIGLGYFSIPLSSFNRPPDKTVAEVLALINAAENQPVFVHCERGADRTGTIVAIYRIDHDGWTSDQAKAEAKRYGLGFWQIEMKDYIHDYYLRRTRTNAESASRQSRPRIF